jgi:hypothetical protein
MSEHKYKLKYEFKPEAGEFTADEIKEAGVGGTDAVLFFSCIYPEDGSLSIRHDSFDGRNGGKPMTSQEMFKMWMLIGKKLSQDPELGELRREIAGFPAESFFKVMKNL